MGLDLPQKGRHILLLFALDLCAEPDGLFVQALLNDLFNAVKGSAADKQNVFGVDLNELLVRMRCV